MPPPAETLICLVRHGESAWNLEGRVQGQQDPPLSELGLRQAEAVARALAAHPQPWHTPDSNNLSAQPRPWHALFSSDLTRALQTAQAIGRHTGLPILPDPDLRERGQGTLEGLLLSEAAAIPDVDAPEINREPLANITQRTHRALTRLLSPSESPDDNPTERRLIVVTHGALIQHTLETLGLPPSPAAPRNGSLTLLRLTPSYPVDTTNPFTATLLTFDDTSHLPNQVSASQVNPFYASFMSPRRPPT